MTLLDLSYRVLSSHRDWYKDFTMEPSTSTEINLTLDLAGIHEALQDMNFYELKGTLVANCYTSLSLGKGVRQSSDWLRN